MTHYYLPFPKTIRRSQDFGANPGWGPNPPGGHNGDDWATPVGTPVRAAGDGEVLFAGQFDQTYADNFGWNLHYGGLMVILNMDGPEGPYFEYGHNSRLLVKAGERVVAGQIIAITGNTDGGTGISTGPHCHVGALPPGFNLNTGTYGRVNPRTYMTRYWDDNTIQLAGTGATTKKEDTLSASEVKQIIEYVDAAHEVTRGHVNDQAKATREFVQAAHDVTRGYLADHIKNLPAHDLAALIPDTIAADVVTALSNRLNGAQS